MCPAGWERAKDTCKKKWRAIAYQKLSNGVIEDNVCNPDNCWLNRNGNFFNLKSKARFDKFKDTNSCIRNCVDSAGTSISMFGLQLAWREDSCTVVVLEWEQNWNPLDDT